MTDEASFFTAPQAATDPLSLTACVHQRSYADIKIHEGFEEFTRQDWVPVS